MPIEAEEIEQQERERHAAREELRRRIGTFIISGKIGMDCELIPEVIRRLKFVPVAMNYNWAYGQFEYMGCSPRFGIVTKGSAIPRYTVTVRMDEDPVSGLRVIGDVSVEGNADPDYERITS